jgi:hypothetical protein
MLEIIIEDFCRLVKEKRKQNLYKCLLCGTNKVITEKAVKSGNTRSCGCLHKQKLIDRNTTHGGRYDKEYSIWCNVKKRCYNKNSQFYYRYGGRGIVMCDKWKNDYRQFLADMGRIPKDKTSIGRIDNDGIYEPGNCRWITHVKNCNNRSTSRRIFDYKGKKYTITELQRLGGFKQGTLQERVKNGWDIERAMDTPVKKYKYK